MLRHKKNVFLKKSTNQLQDMQSVVWQEIEQLYQEFQKLGISEAVDYEKYYLYSLITHSTAIEGSTLTEAEAQMLFDEGLTAKGKPLVYHLMNEDLKKAYELAKTDSVSLIPSVTAGIGGWSYMNYQKVPAKVDELCALLQEKQKIVGTLREQYELSFNAHLNLVTIHPWVDGNGRTARLLMNYIQFCHNLFPTKIFKEDREEYILSLRQSQEEENNRYFLDFMFGQLKKSLLLEIEKFNSSRKKGFSFMF